MSRYHLSFTRLVATLIMGAAALFSLPARADTTFGVRTGVYTDAEAAFLGGEAVVKMAPHWYFNPNLEATLNADRDVFSVNADFHYDFFTDRSYWVWAGAGPAFIHRQEPVDGDDDDLGANIFGGIGWKTRSQVSPYVQAKVTLSDVDEAVLAVGMRF
jgi:hypothetical protein